MEYSVAIRTLGTAGNCYQKTLNSLLQQTIKPTAIIIYIAEGYPLPKESIGIERYVYVKKGMVAQRALPYYEINTEYILFLDDDIYLPPNGVENLYNNLTENKGDVIAPTFYSHHLATIKSKCLLYIMGKEVPRIWNHKMGYKVLRTGGFSYNNNPIEAIYESTTNAGACFFCKKQDFLKIHYEEDVWLDETPYALPDDQVMFYKMHLNNLKILTSFNSGIVHLDASTALTNNNEKILNTIYSEHRNKIIFWYKYIYCYQNCLLLKTWSLICILYMIVIQYAYLTLKLTKGEKDKLSYFHKGVVDAYKYLRRIKTNN